MSGMFTTFLKMSNVDMLETTILAITTLILIIFSVQDPRLDQMTPMKTELVMGSEGGSQG